VSQAGIEGPSTVSIDPKSLEILIDAITVQFGEVAERVVARQMSQLQQCENWAATTGVSVPQHERVKAIELRSALLLGKLPENAGLLIDTRTAAHLLNVSSRTLCRLLDIKAIPEPVRLGGRLIRWRVAELLEWIEAGCPSPKLWVYPQLPKTSKARR